jgi:hypothetical protein
MRPRRAMSDLVNVFISGLFLPFCQIPCQVKF